MRLAVDTGGTFTDLVVEYDEGRFSLYKTPTTPSDPAAGVMAVIEIAAQESGRTLGEFLSQADLLIHGTTRGLNAILTGETARTAFVTTRGHRDILLFREGGRREPFNNARRYPPPYIPRRLTYEVTERVAADGRILIELDEEEAVRALEQLTAERVEAVGVCFLWSIANPAHELRVGELLQQYLPAVPFTLSHQLNPVAREYRRASSACIDASLKPVMSRYLSALAQRVGEAGFGGRLLIVTSQGGVMDVDAVIAAPIHSLRSGPAMAPVAGRDFARTEASLENAIVADAGGTSYDVSLVRRGRIPWTREAWIGEELIGHITGFPSVDVKSIGSGGGSIAWVDREGLLRVGPESAGADPGPACYGQGATRPTVTDASLVLGYLDPGHFLGGRIQLDRAAAEEALLTHVGEPLGLDVVASAAAVFDVMTEQMVQAIDEVTVRQGLDPASAVLVAGGGSSGFNCVSIARRLGCSIVLVPEIAAGLSAAGALLSDLIMETHTTYPTSTARFDHTGVNAVLAELGGRCEAFLRGAGRGAISSSVEFFGEARYPDQVWELELPLRVRAFDSSEAVEMLRRDFHDVHRETFAVADDAAAVEVVTWGARAQCRLRAETASPPEVREHQHSPVGRRRAYFDGGLVDCEVHSMQRLAPETVVTGPAVIESGSLSIAVPAEASLSRTPSGMLRISPWARQPMPLLA
jgi:N-methylhydantoinase A